MDADASAHVYDILLPGEAASMSNPSERDIEHWIRVYNELCQFKELFLGSLVDQRERVSLEGRPEIDHDDVLLRNEYARLRRRLQYWQLQSAAQDRGN